MNQYTSYNYECLSNIFQQKNFAIFIPVPLCSFQSLSCFSQRRVLSSKCNMCIRIWFMGPRHLASTILIVQSCWLVINYVIILWTYFLQMCVGEPEYRTPVATRKVCIQSLCDHMYAWSWHHGSYFVHSPKLYYVRCTVTKGRTSSGYIPFCSGCCGKSAVESSKTRQEYRRKGIPYDQTWYTL